MSAKITVRKGVLLASVYLTAFTKGVYGAEIGDDSLDRAGGERVWGGRLSPSPPSHIRELEAGEEESKGEDFSRETKEGEESSFNSDSEDESHFRGGGGGSIVWGGKRAQEWQRTIQKQASLRLGEARSSIESSFRKGCYFEVRTRLQDLANSVTQNKEMKFYQSMVLLALGEEVPHTISLQDYISVEKNEGSLEAQVAWAVLLYFSVDPEEQWEGVKKLMTLAEEAPAAAFLLGVLYKVGSSLVTQDVEKAKQYLEEGMKKGHAECTFLLAQIHAQMADRAAPNDEVVRNLSLAAEQGHPIAKCKLAMILLAEKKKEDKMRALQLLKESADTGYVVATHNLGLYKLQHRSYYEGLCYMTRAYQKSLEAKHNSLQKYGEKRPKTAERLETLTSVYDKFIEKGKPLGTYLPFGNSAEEDESILGVLRVFLASNAPLEKREAILLQLAKEIDRLTPPVKREVYAYLNATNTSPGFRAELYKRLLENIEVLRNDPALCEALWKKYESFIANGLSEEKKDEVLLQQMKKLWPLYREKGVNGMEKSFLQTVSERPELIQRELKENIQLSIRRLADEAVLYPITAKLLGHLARRESSAEVRELSDCCREVFNRHVALVAPHKMFREAENRERGRQILKQARKGGIEELAILYVAQVASLQNEELRTIFLERALEDREQELALRLEKLLISVTFLLRDANNIAFPKLAEIEIPEGLTKEEKEERFQSFLENYELNWAMINDPRVAVLNTKDFGENEVASVTQEEYAVAVESFCNKFETLINLDNRESMCFDKNFDEEEASHQKLMAYLSNAPYSQTSELNQTGGDIPYHDFFRSRPNGVDLSALEGFPTREAKWKHFWSEGYKETRAQLWKCLESWENDPEDLARREAERNEANSTNPIERGMVRRTVLGTKVSLRDLITNHGAPDERFKVKVVKLAQYFNGLPNETVATQLASWSCAGYNCKARSLLEVSMAYRGVLQSEGRHFGRLPYIIAEILEKMRRHAVAMVVPASAYEPEAQRQYLVGVRLFKKLGLYGDDNRTRAPNEEMSVDERYRDPQTPAYVSDETLMGGVLQTYTVPRIVDLVYNALKAGDIAYTLIDKEVTSPPRRHEFYETVDAIAEFFEWDEELVPHFTKKAALSVLIGLGYIVPTPRDK